MSRSTLALRWSDIDFDERISITEQLSGDKPKTDAGNRTVDVFPAVVD
jgi:integrase